MKGLDQPGPCRDGILSENLIWPRQQKRGCLVVLMNPAIQVYGRKHFQHAEQRTWYLSDHTITRKMKHRWQARVRRSAAMCKTYCVRQYDKITERNEARSRLILAHCLRGFREGVADFMAAWSCGSGNMKLLAYISGSANRMISQEVTQKAILQQLVLSVRSCPLKIPHPFKTAPPSGV